MCPTCMVWYGVLIFGQKFCNIKNIRDMFYKTLNLLHNLDAWSINEIFLEQSVEIQKQILQNFYKMENIVSLVMVLFLAHVDAVIITSPNVQ